MLATFALAARQDPIATWVGATTGMVAANLVAVAVGRQLGDVLDLGGSHEIAVHEAATKLEDAFASLRELLERLGYRGGVALHELDPRTLEAHIGRLAKSRPIETCPTVPYRMKPMPGGMMGVISDPKERTPAAKPREKPRLRNSAPSIRNSGWHRASTAMPAIQARCLPRRRASAPNREIPAMLPA